MVWANSAENKISDIFTYFFPRKWYLTIIAIIETYFNISYAEKFN